MYTIKQIQAQEAYTVRHPVLREGKPIESCSFPNDDLISTQHFGLFVNKKIVGVVSLFQNKNATFSAENQWQIRGMAVLPHFQKKGFGRKLISHCEENIDSKNVVIWFNARENAVPFYEKLGYKKMDNAFVIENIGLHFVMYKEFNNVNE